MGRASPCRYTRPRPCDENDEFRLELSGAGLVEGMIEMPDGAAVPFAFQAAGDGEVRRDLEVP